MLCSFVNPCGPISFSHAGLGETPVNWLFSFRAVFAKFMRYIVSYWFLWHEPHFAGSVMVAGRALFFFRCASVPVWHSVQATVLCLPGSWNSLSSSWHSMHSRLAAGTLPGAAVFAGAAAVFAGTAAAFAGAALSAAAAKSPPASPRAAVARAARIVVNGRNGWMVMVLSLESPRSREGVFHANRQTMCSFDNGQA